MNWEELSEDLGLASSYMRMVRPRVVKDFLERVIRAFWFGEE